MLNKLPKIVTVVGPTASGKTDLAILLAKKFNGEIISADSRQIYKQMNIGTAKPAGEWKTFDGRQAYFVSGIPHYLMDIINPDENFTVADFKERAQKIISDIISRKKIPIVAGGTGLYVWSLVDNLDIPKTEPNSELRQELNKKSLPELVEMLKEKDPKSALKIDLKNPRRVSRALEVCLLSGESFYQQRKKIAPLYNVLSIGLNISREQLYDNIGARVDKQMASGLVEEVKNLIGAGYAGDLQSMNGIGYRQFFPFLKGEKSLFDVTEILKRDTRHYAKRQLTWFKRDKNIHWVNNADEAVKLTERFAGK